MLAQRAIAPKLPVGAGVLARPACGTGDGIIWLRVHRIGGGFAPLRSDRGHKLQSRQRVYSYRGFEVNEIHKPGVSGEGYVVAVGKEGIESVELIIVRVFITRGRIDLKTQTRRPRNRGERIPAQTSERPSFDISGGSGSSGRNLSGISGKAC